MLTCLYRQVEKTMIKTLYQAPFLRLCFSFIIGILLAFYRILPVSFLVGLGAVALLLILLSYIPFALRSYPFRWLFGSGVLLFFVTLGALLTAKSVQQTEWHETGKRDFRVRMLGEPVEKPKTWMCPVEVEGKRALLYIAVDDLSALPGPGDNLRVYTRFEPQEIEYLRRKGIAARAFASRGNWEVIPGEKAFSLRMEALKVRRKMLALLKSMISDERSFSVAAALMTGSQEDIDEETRRLFSATGSSHVLSISGLHFSFIYGMLYFLFSFLGNNRKAKLIRQLIILPAIWIYAFITGLGPTVVRSVLMLSLWGVGEALFFRPFTLNTLSVAAFLMLLFNPLYLFDVGFQLSFSAVLSILLINPALTGLYQSRNPLLNYLWGLSTVSVSAQLGTIPFSLYYFGQFPLLFLPANLLIIPLVNLLMLLLPASMLLFFLFPGVAFLTLPLSRLLHLFLNILEALESVPNGLLEGIDLSPAALFFTTLYLILLTLLFVKKRIVYLYLTLLFVSLQVFHYFCYR